MQAGLYQIGYKLFEVLHNQRCGLNFRNFKNIFKITKIQTTYLIMKHVNEFLTNLLQTSYSSGTVCMHFNINIANLNYTNGII